MHKQFPAPLPATRLTTSDSVYGYMAVRSAIFFQALLTGIATVNNGQYSLGQSKFVECPNTRYGCETDYHNAACENNDCD